MAQEEEQHRHRQDQADRTGLGQFQQRGGHRLALVVDHLDLHVAHRRLRADRFDLGQRRARDFHQVGAAFLEDVQADRRVAVQATPVVHPRRFQAHVGDVAQAQALGVDHQVAHFLQVGDLAHRLHAHALAVVIDLPGGDREVQRAQALAQLIDAQTVRVEAVRIDGDLHLVRRRAGDVDAGHAGDALDAPLELAVEHVIGSGQVGGAGQPHLQHRLVTAGPLEHVVALQVIGQVAADRIDAFACIGGGDGDVAVPVAELDEDQRRLGGGRRAHALDAGHRRQRFLHRADDGPLHFLRRRTGVRDLYEQERRGDVRQRFQRQPERGDQADHHQ